MFSLSLDCPLLITTPSSFSNVYSLKHEWYSTDVVIIIASNPGFNTIVPSPLFKLYLFMSFCHYQSDRLKSACGHKSAYIHEISLSWRQYLKSRSDLRVFAKRRPFQILIYGRFIAIKSTPLSERRFLWTFTLSRDGCGSSLYIICITYYIKWMQNVKVPDIHSVRLASVLSTKKLISDKPI